MTKLKLSVLTAGIIFTVQGINAIEMTDYKVVEGTYEEAYINGALTIEGGNQDQTSYNGHLDANTKTIHTTAPYSWEFSLQGNSDFSKGATDGDSSEKSYDVGASTRFDKYLYNDDTWFVYGGGDLGYRKQVTADEADDPFVKVGAGMGYGRMYDATPLAVAFRIVEDLQSYKILSKGISDEGMLALAKVIDLEEEYISKHGLADYKKYWYTDMEKSLKATGALASDSLGAFGIVRINEIIDLEKISGRFHGWKVRGGLGEIISNFDGVSESTTVDAEFEYGLPIGYESQFTERAIFSKVLDDKEPIDFQFTNTASYTYELADRVDWENAWTLGYDAYDQGDDVITNTLSTGFRYYLANRLTVDTTLSLSKTNGTNGQSIETPEWDSFHL
ncbi:MAG: Unknown protein [uncultured Sulfurovum sp.]|uniref:Uncharacterized protein n=1 Tax=uncultured Sulfurovum sp. TaxID=269237 RepID=A0A6S6S8K9_9BACT|nr:MAG: Unknown protein [uncultured Sulfurovum sp.]